MMDAEGTRERPDDEAGMATARGPELWHKLVALAILVSAMVSAQHYIGLPPVVIVGGSGVIGFTLWLLTFRGGPIEPSVILPPFLLTVAALEAHMIEEWNAGFGPAMSRLFDISWSENGFLMVFAFVGPIIYSLTALGLYQRRQLAGFVAWFIFIGPGVAEFTHFIFPLLTPSIQPGNPAAVTAWVSNGREVEGMRNFFVGTTGVYYFPGLYTAVLPMIPGIYGIIACLRESRRKGSAARDRGSSHYASAAPVPITEPSLSGLPTR